MSERKLIVEVSRKLYPEIFHQEDLLPYSPNILLAVSSSGSHVSDYRFAIGSMSPFYLDNNVQTHTASGNICAETGDFPQLRHKTFADGLQALVDNLVARNSGLVVDFDPAVISAINGYVSVKNLIGVISNTEIIGQEDISQILRDLGVELGLEELSLARLKNRFSLEQPRKISIIEAGVHYWRMIREVERIIYGDVDKMQAIFKE